MECQFQNKVFEVVEEETETSLLEKKSLEKTELYILSFKDNTSFGIRPENDSVFDNWWLPKVENLKSYRPYIIKRLIGGFCPKKSVDKIPRVGRANSEILDSKYELTCKKSEEKDLGDI